MICLNNSWQYTPEWSEDFPSGKGKSVPVRIPHTVSELPLHYADPLDYQKISGYRRILPITPDMKGKRIARLAALLLLMAAGAAAEGRTAARTAAVLESPGGGAVGRVYAEPNPAALIGVDHRHLREAAEKDSLPRLEHFQSALKTLSR